MARNHLRRRTAPGYRLGRAAIVATVAAILATVAVPVLLGAGPPQDPPGAIVAAFARPSYRPGDSAVLVLRRPVRGTVTVAPAWTLVGAVPYAPATRVNSTRVHVRVPSRSGLYVAVVSSGRRIGYAPLVVRPRRLGDARVLVVLPTNTWQAYNFRGGDSWYFDPAVHTIDLRRPFVSPGLPPHFRSYDLNFQTWLARHGKHPDVIADEDLDAIASGDELARRYDLVVFPGHEEYVTPHMYDLVARYRDLGGNLAFLSADNLFYRVAYGEGRRLMTGRQRFRDLGRPEAALIGAQYVDWNHDLYGNRPYVVADTHAAPWLFRGTGLHDGSVIPGSFGIEIDARTPESPRGTLVLARIANEFGPGKTAEMTYYRTARGAKVFAAGTINFGGAARNPVVSRLLANLWDWLRRP